MNPAPREHLDDPELDRRIRALGNALDEITPSPPHFDELRPDERPGVSRLVPAAAAVVLVVAGVAAIAFTGRSDDRPDAPAQQPPVSATPTPTLDPTPFAASQTGPLLHTQIDASVTPLIELPGWDVTYAYSDDDQPVSEGGFEGALVLIGDGQRYDAPLFAATTITRPVPSRTDPIATTPLENPELDLATLGEPVTVAGTTGYASSTPTDPDTQLAGPIVTVFWELDETRYVRVNAVRPGLTRTAATDSMFEMAPLLDRFLEEQPIRKPGEAEDIARAIRFLAGDEASWITGQCLTVDGGHTIRKFPRLEDVARSVAGDALFDAIERGEAG